MRGVVTGCVMGGMVYVVLGAGLVFAPLLTVGGIVGMAIGVLIAVHRRVNE